MSLWLDRVLVTPSFGILTQPWIAFPQAIWPALEKVNASWPSSAATRVTATGQVGVQVDRGNGVTFTLDPSNVVGGFAYRIGLRSPPGKLPELQVEDEIISFSDALERVLQETEPLLHATQARRVLRIGIVADCQLTVDSLPPGAVALYDHLSQPYGSQVESVSAQVQVSVGGSGQSRDRCHYWLITGSREPASAARLRLDWQRLWEPPVQTAGSSMMEHLRACVQAALTHFEAFGAGETDHDYTHATA